MFWSKKLTKNTYYTSFYMAALLFNDLRNGISNSLYSYTYTWPINFLFINLFNESVHFPKDTVTGDELDWRLSVIQFVKFRFEIGLNFSVMEILNFPSVLRIFCHFGQEKTVAAIKNNDMPDAKSGFNHGLQFMQFYCTYLLL